MSAERGGGENAPHPVAHPVPVAAHRLYLMEGWSCLRCTAVTLVCCYQQRR